MRSQSRNQGVLLVSAGSGVLAEASEMRVEMQNSRRPELKMSLHPEKLAADSPDKHRPPSLVVEMSK